MRGYAKGTTILFLEDCQNFLEAYGLTPDFPESLEYINFSLAKSKCQVVLFELFLLIFANFLYLVDCSAQDFISMYTYTSCNIFEVNKLDPIIKVVGLRSRKILV